MSEAPGPGPPDDRSVGDALLRWAALVPVPARRPSRPRRWPKRTALALVVVAGLALAALVTTQLLDPDPAPPADQARPSATPRATTTTKGTDPGRTDPGVHVQVTPHEDGTLDVVEQIRFLGAATGLQIALPEVEGVVTGALPAATELVDLEVLADGHRLPRQAGSLSAGGRVLLPNAPLAVELRYRLVGAATVSSPSTPGRALVLLPPIADDDSLTKLPVVVEIGGPGVRNVVCPGLAPDEQLCGRKTAAGWRTIFLPPRATAVLAQLDLTSY